MSDLEQIARLLRSFPLLSDQKDEILRQLSANCKVLSFRVGQVISRADHEYSEILFIIKGSVRSVVMSDRLPKRLATLQKLGPGSICGWSGLGTNLNRESLIASSDAVGLVISHKNFIDIASRVPQLLKRINSSVNCAELFFLLNKYFRDFPQPLASELVEFCPSFANQCLVVSCASEDLVGLKLDNHCLWLVASGGYESGTLYPTSQPLKTAGPVRLVGIPRDDLQQWLKDATRENADLTSDQSTLSDEASIENYSDQWELRFRQLDQSLIEVASEYKPVKIQDHDSSPKSLDQYPWYPGKSGLDSAIAALTMLSEFYNMPNRRELITRILSDYLKSNNEISLALIGAILESLGLQTQLLNISSEGIMKLSTPIFIRWGDGSALIYRLSKDNLIIGVPSVGMLQLSYDEFYEQWGSVGEVLPIRKSEFTPQKSFGFQWFIPALKEHRVILIEVLLASFFVQLFGLINPLLIQQIIDKVVINNNTSALGVFSILLIVFALFEGLLLALRTFLFVDTTNRIDLSLGTQIIDHLLRLPLSYFDQRPVGEVSSRIGELEKIRAFLTGTVLTTVLDAIFALLYIAVMSAYSWQLTLVTLSVIPALVILTLTFAPSIKSQLQKRAIASAKTQSYLVELLSGIMTVKSQNIELRSRWKWQDLYTDFVAEGFDNTILSTTSNTLSSFLNKLSSLLVICVGAKLILDGQLTLGELIAFRIIAGYVTGPLLRMTSIWQTLQETSLSLSRLADVIDHPQESSEKNQNLLLMPPIVGSVVFKDISFRYKPSSPLLLKSVNLELPAGKFIAVVGSSGSGKSTLTKLLARLYKPEEGSIFVDGIDISKVELYSYRAQLGVVPQDSVLFDGSVEENIALTAPSASINDVVEAAKVAGADDFIMGLPAGYSTQVGERGSGLSGGQRQRVAIARTVLKNPNLLIMDEATSALDYQTERIVCDNLMRALKGSTVLFITHRLSSIKNADLIVCMGNGSVLEIGTHEELMNRRGAYFALYKQQGRSSSSEAKSFAPMNAI